MADYQGVDDAQVVVTVTPELLAEVKTALRVSSGTTAFDAEISALIEAAIGDLVLSGVAVETFTTPPLDALPKLAVIVYCKAMFGLDNPDSEKYLASFHSLETSLGLSSEYKAVTE